LSGGRARLLFYQAYGFDLFLDSRLLIEQIGLVELSNVDAYGC